MKNGHSKSYGVIAYSTIGPVRKFLLIQRKYSHSYVAIIRGHYSLENKTYLKELAEKITPLERLKLLNSDFDYMWIKLWSFSNNKMFHDEYEKAKNMFKVLKNKHILSKIFREISPKWNEPEWGFPKGKRYYGEHDSETACREFLEESAISSHQITLYDENEIPPICEQYMGDNGVTYEYLYYIAKLETSDDGTGYVNPWNLTQSGEVGKVSWCTYDQAKKLIRPYNVSRLDVLDTINTFLS